MPNIVFDTTFKSVQGDNFTRNGTTSIPTTLAPLYYNRWRLFAVYNSSADLTLSSIDSISTLGQMDTFESANRLIYWNTFLGGGGGVDFLQDVTSDDTQTIQTYITNASASGTAAQFLVGWANTSPGINPSGSSTDMEGIMVGTIGTSPSGGDMVLANTSITAGNEYSVNAQFKVFADFAY